MAEWWANECGGVYCSNCGLFHDDAFENPPIKCPNCCLDMTEDTDIMVHRDYRLSHIYESTYINEAEYPEWLLKFRKGVI